MAYVAAIDGLSEHCLPLHPSLSFPAVDSSLTPSVNGHHGQLHLRSASSTVDLFAKAVSTARRRLHESGEKDGSLTIDLNRRNIEVIPPAVVSIIQERVARIVLAYNQISRLPHSFSECTNIAYLSLRGNRFTEFPTAVSSNGLHMVGSPDFPQLFSLLNLQVLEFSRNELTQIPEAIRGMESLRFFSVVGNRLQRLPYSLGFLDGLAILRIAENPLNDSLRAQVETAATLISPASHILGENEKDRRVTQKIKEYLKSEAAILESPADSRYVDLSNSPPPLATPSSESPLNTPRPKKSGSTTSRFPVVPTSAGSENSSGPRSPTFSKPPIPIRSHYRIVSSQNSVSPRTGFRGAHLEPLIITNERNRSNSESVIQASQNSRNRRMGIMPKPRGDLESLAESDTSHNSTHIRGASHGSAVKDKRPRGWVPGFGSNTSQSSSTAEERAKAFYSHRLSSVPEQRSQNQRPDYYLIEAVRGLLFALHSLHSSMARLMSLATDSAGKRSSVQRVYMFAFSQLDKLDKELKAFDNSRSRNIKRRNVRLESLRSSSESTIRIYQQVMKSFAEISPMLLKKADPRYIRMLMFSLYYATVEIRCTELELVKHISPSSLARLTQPTVPEMVFPPRVNLPPAAAPPQEKAGPAFPPQRYRGDTIDSQKNQNGQLDPARVYDTTTPLFSSARSRSSSRSGIYASSNLSDYANTPRSGVSFLVPETPSEPSFERGTIFDAISSSMSKSTSSATPGPIMNSYHDFRFETIQSSFLEVTGCCEDTMPEIVEQLRERKYEAKNSGDKARLDLWENLLKKALQFKWTCETLYSRLHMMQPSDPQIRQERDDIAFWAGFRRIWNAFSFLLDDLKLAKVEHAEEMVWFKVNMLKPVAKKVKAAVTELKASPWAGVLEQNSVLSSSVERDSEPESTLPESSLVWNNHLAPETNGFDAGIEQKTKKEPAHSVAHESKSSLPSPYILPTTPLSAALGPAVQATVPSSTSNSTNSPHTLNMDEQAFQGNFFDRADRWLQQSDPRLKDRRR